MRANPPGVIALATVLLAFSRARATRAHSLGTAGNYTFYGISGHDDIFGRAGDDTLYGAPDDTRGPAKDEDEYFCGARYDVVHLEKSEHFARDIRATCEEVVKE